MDSRCVHSASPITVSARTCQQWQVPLWSWILRTRLVDSRKSNLRVAWRGSQRVNYLYLCTVLYMFVKQWRNCGWRWDLINNTILLSFILCITPNLLYIIKIIFKHRLNQPKGLPHSTKFNKMIHRNPRKELIFQDYVCPSL